MPKFNKIIFLKFISNPFFIALFLTICIASFINYFPKYSAKLLESGSKSAAVDFIYNDLNNNGESNRIEIFKDFVGNPAVIVYEGKKTIDQWNFTGEFVGIEYTEFGDYDMNGFKEIPFFTSENDSLFLWYFEPHTKREIISRKFISQHYSLESGIDINIYYTQLLGKESPKKLCISTSCSFSYRPRQLFLYDFEKDKVTSSPQSASNYTEPIFTDIDKDGKVEITGFIPAFGNSPATFPYSDQFCWLMVHNEDLSFKFQPVKVGKYPGTVSIKPMKLEDGDVKLVVLYLHAGLVDQSKLSIYSTDGELEKQIIIDPGELNCMLEIVDTKKRNYIDIYHKVEGIVYRYNPELKLISQKKTIKLKLGTSLIKLDIDNDGQNEFISISKETEQFVIMQKKLKYPVFIDTKNGIEGNTWFSIKNHNNSNSLFISRDDHYFSFGYKKNNLFLFNFILPFGIYFLFYLFVVGLSRLQKIRLEQKYKDEKQMAQLQITAIENQLTPHFNLNVLNSIGALYESSEKEKAQYYLGKYGKLMRNLLLYSGNISVRVEEELEFTRNYLELEKLRMNHSFEYTISGETDYLDLEIPKMLIHTFCENSLKHGLRHLPKNGKLDILFSREKKQLTIFISDNGIGREKARQYSLMSTGKGLKIINQTLELYFQLNQVRIKYNISDIYDDQKNETGTQIEITIPI